jgi:hypothetical protein
MTERQAIPVTLPADVAQVDQTGYVWTFLDRPFLARVIDIVDGPDGRHIVPLDVVGVPEQAIEVLPHPRLLAN